MKDGIYQHFRKEEQTFIRTTQEWIEQCLDHYGPVITYFLDPRQQFIVHSIAGQFEDLKFSFFGGYEFSERKRCIFYPSYYNVREEDFDCALFEIGYPMRFSTLSHSKILGSLMGTGIIREHIGDIVTDGEKWQLVCSESMKEYIKVQCQKVGSVSVRLKELSFTEVLRPIDEWENKTFSLSSLRIDTVISTIFNISRQRAKELVESQKVKLNWAIQDRPDEVIEPSDILSVRGFGRIRFHQIHGETKKGKIRIEAGILTKK